VIPTLIRHAVPANETPANGLNMLMRSLGTSIAAAAIAAVLAQSAVNDDEGSPTPTGSNSHPRSA